MLPRCDESGTRESAVMNSMLTPLFLVLLMSLHGSEDDSKSALKSFIEEGKTYGKTVSTTAPKDLLEINTEELMPKDQRGKTFDADQAKHYLNEDVPPQSEVVDFLESPSFRQNIAQSSLTGKEPFLDRAEEIFQMADDYLHRIVEERVVEETIEKCFQSDHPEILSLYRQLEVNVIHHPEKYAICKICLGHKIKSYHFWESDAEHEKKKLEKILAADPTIKTFEVHIKGGGGFSDYKVEATYSHCDDTAICTNYEKKSRVIAEESWEETGDIWQLDASLQRDIVSSPDCMLLKISCVDDSPSKVINGKTVYRKCWAEKLDYLCKRTNKDGCASLKEKGCECIKRVCCEEGPFGCVSWEAFYKCPFRISRKQTAQNGPSWIGKDDDLWDADYEPNHSFHEVSSKLAVFDEMKKELEASGTHHAKNVTVFRGQKMECSKSVAEELLYDCCFSYKGLANQVHLSKCSAEELGLGEMREKGLCHYVGHYDEKFIELWKSKTVHTYCCFGSKLARIFQEEFHKQTETDWGSIKHPHCSGLTIDDIAKVDFTKLDMSPLFEGERSVLPSNFQEKLDAFQGKVRSKLEEKI